MTECNLTPEERSMGTIHLHPIADVKITHMFGKDEQAFFMIQTPDRVFYRYRDFEFWGFEDAAFGTIYVARHLYDERTRFEMPIMMQCPMDVIVAIDKEYEAGRAP